MLFAIFWTFIKAFADIFWKKSLIFWLRPYAYNLCSYPLPSLFFLYFVLTGFSIFMIESIMIVWATLLLLSGLIRQPVIQQIYREEKISAIMPYTNLNKILVIITSFFFFGDVSHITFFITLFTVAIIIYASIDLKNTKLPRNFSKILFNESIISIEILFGWWLVLEYWELTYFNAYFLIWLITYIIAVWISKQYMDVIKAPIEYWKFRVIGSLGWAAMLISLVAINELWLSVSILLGFLWIWMTLIFSYTILGDTPSRRNMFLTMIVSVLIWIWYYFKSY